MKTSRSCVPSIFLVFTFLRVMAEFNVLGNSANLELVFVSRLFRQKDLKNERPSMTGAYQLFGAPVLISEGASGRACASLQTFLL